MVAIPPPIGCAALDEGLCRMPVKNGSVLWIPEQKRVVQARLMVCAHTREVGYRGMAATIRRLRRQLSSCVVWNGLARGPVRPAMFILPGL